MLLKALFGTEIGSKLIVDKRKAGWKTDIINTHQLPKRLICKKIIADMGVLTSDYHSTDLGQVTLDKAQLYESLKNIMSMSKDGIIRKYAGTILGTSVDHLLDALKPATESLGLRLWIAYFLGQLNMTKDLDDLIMSSSKKDDWSIIPSFSEIVGYLLVNSLITHLFTKTDIAVKDITSKIDTSKVSSVDLRTIANRIWLVWRDTITQVNRVKTEVVTTSEHFEALMVKMIKLGPEYIPSDITQDQVAQMRTYGNMWYDALFVGVTPALDSPNENYAWAFYSALISEITQKDSWLEVCSTADFVTTILEAEDHVGRYLHGEMSGQNYIHRHFKPRVPDYAYDSFRVYPYDLENDLVMLEKTSGLGSKVTEFMNDVRRVVDAKEYIDAVLPLSEGLVSQQDIVNHASGDMTEKLYGDLMDKAINLALLTWTDDIDFEMGREPTFLVNVPAELSKMVAGVESTEEGLQEVDNASDALAIIFKNNLSNPSSMVKHVHPYYCGNSENPDDMKSTLWNKDQLQETTAFTGLMLKSCFSDKAKAYDGSLNDIFKIGDASERLTKNVYVTEDINREISRTTAFMDLTDLGVVFSQKFLGNLIKLAHKYTSRWVKFKIQKKAGFLRMAPPVTPAAKVTLAENELATFEAILCVIDPVVASSFNALVHKVLSLSPLSTLNLSQIMKE